ncbi:AAA family ATPase [Mycobacterium sp. MYCO198283]|uniref:AAA family ATPase n=1 Tax=Mycobacterium sp. MYCO198283 TaxID=2883505 RepID=UPI001E457C79|nr:AAA family ATPase [Mycobacterium sp. MYCO198283]MCG5431949.1 AAA family ATPase [Mycobacterium sp. MYCO198283]
MGESETAELSVQDVIMELLDEDAGLNAAVKDAVLDALSEVVDNAETQHDDVAPTFLTSISVVGFRGVGPQARLDLYPAPGLTVVSGRNGSGKSSFAEALELALTGTSYRWLKKEKLWEEAWRNLHHPSPCAIRVGFTAEGTGPFEVGIDWDDDAALSDHTSWTKAGSGKRIAGTDHLGWSRPLELWRPVLSYDELGRLFDGGPAALYDALAKLLGLEVLSDAEKRLAARLKETRSTRDRADAERKRLLAVLARCDDERALLAAKALKKHGGADLATVQGLATGSGDLQVTPALRALNELDAPSLDEVGSAVAQLRDGVNAVDTAARALADGTRERVALLQAALEFHDHTGDTQCPVCGEGTLDRGWAASTREAIAKTQQSLQEYRGAATALAQARRDAMALLAGLDMVDEVAGVELPALATFNDAVAAARQAPDGETELAAHLEATVPAVIATAEALRNQADVALKQRESVWVPLAVQLGAWVPAEEAARELDGTVKTMTAAKKWMNDHAGQFRNLRLKPVAAQARTIWNQLRQESNVELGDITLTGTATKRRAVLSGSVDGEPTKALSVMSQGELHALALALFLPRATAAQSPFRFVVLDDPIQAMDPSKIDGFVQVLSDFAGTHQVVVFSHDDRLASVIRETGVDARLIEVVRESGSRVSVRDNINPAIRQVNDVFALIKDERLPDDIRARVLPGLFRVAVEAAARQAFYTRQALAGRSRTESEAAWASARKTRSRLSLAVHGDAGADLSGWLMARPSGSGRSASATPYTARREVSAFPKRGSWSALSRRCWRWYEGRRTARPGPAHPGHAHDGRVVAAHGGVPRAARARRHHRAAGARC